MMENTAEPKAFIFNQKIDSNLLYSLYENDYVYIEEIFKTVLDHYNTDLASIRTNYAENNLEGLRKAVHKMKPAFGYVGMPHVQELCNRFEQKVSISNEMAELNEELQMLLQTFDECKTILETDYNNLCKYNHANS